MSEHTPEGKLFNRLVSATEHSVILPVLRTIYRAGGRTACVFETTEKHRHPLYIQSIVIGEKGLLVVYQACTGMQTLPYNMYTTPQVAYSFIQLSHHTLEPWQPPSVESLGGISIQAIRWHRRDRPRSWNPILGWSLVHYWSCARYPRDTHRHSARPPNTVCWRNQQLYNGRRCQCAGWQLDEVIVHDGTSADAQMGAKSFGPQASTQSVPESNIMEQPVCKSNSTTNCLGTELQTDIIQAHLEAERERGAEEHRLAAKKKRKLRKLPMRERLAEAQLQVLNKQAATPSPCSSQAPSHSDNFFGEEQSFLIAPELWDTFLEPCSSHSIHCFCCETERLFPPPTTIDPPEENRCVDPAALV